MHILLTRQLEDCYEMILRLKSLGHKVSHLPLLNVEKTNYEKINFSEYYSFQGKSFIDKLYRSISQYKSDIILVEI